MKIPRNSFGVQRIGVVLLGLFASGVCQAAPPTLLDPAQDARARGDRGAHAGDIGAAIAGWREAWKLSPKGWELACNIGRGEARLDHYREAATWLRRCLSLLPDHKTPAEFERRTAVSNELNMVLWQIAILTVHMDEPDVSVVLDDAEVLHTPILEDVYVDPGEHRLQAYKGAKTTFTKISTVAGKRYDVALAFPPSLPADMYPFDPLPGTPEYYRQYTFRWWPVILGGTLTGAGVALGTTFMGLSSSASGDASSTLATIKRAGGSCDKTAAENDPGCATYDLYNRQSSTFSTASIACFIAAGALTAGVIGYAIYEGRRVSVSTNVSSISMSYVW